MVALALVAVLASFALPMILRSSSQLRMELAADEIKATIYLARMTAMKQSTHVGLKFWVAPGSDVSFGLYVDQDGDGVRTADIQRGIDTALGPVRPLLHVGRDVQFGFPPGPAPTAMGSSRTLDRLDDPIRFNRSDIASFGPLGTATPGTVYLTDGRGLLGVRVQSRSGRVFSRRFHPASRTWQ